MSCFSQVRDRLHFSDQWTDSAELTWLHSLLTYADQYNAGGGDPSPNPFTASILRLESAGVNPRAVARIRQMLASEEAKYAAGARP
jgi:hypothetical protein